MGRLGRSLGTADDHLLCSICNRRGQDCGVRGIFANVARLGAAVRRGPSRGFSAVGRTDWASGADVLRMAKNRNDRGVIFGQVLTAERGRYSGFDSADPMEE